MKTFRTQCFLVRFTSFTDEKPTPLSFHLIFVMSFCRGVLPPRMSFFRYFSLRKCRRLLFPGHGNQPPPPPQYHRFRTVYRRCGCKQVMCISSSSLRSRSGGILDRYCCQKRAERGERAGGRRRALARWYMKRAPAGT